MTNQRENDMSNSTETLALLRDKQVAVRDNFRERAVRRLLESGSGVLASDQFGPYLEDVRRADQAADIAGRLGSELEERSSRTRIRVQEARTYGPHAAHSFFRDAALVAAEEKGGVDRAVGMAARARLEQHGREVAFEMRARSAEGVRAERVIANMEGVRVDDVVEHERRARDAIGRTKETRGVTTGGGATLSASGGGGAALVTPMFLEQEWAPYLARSPFVNAATCADIPEYGLEVVIPYFSSDAGTAQQTEGQAITETDPGAGYHTASIDTVAGVVTISQQLFDRSGGTDGPTYDRALAKQLGLDYARNVDVLALTAAIAAGGTVQYTGSFALATTSGTGGFVDKLAAAKYAIRGTAGAYLEPTHAFFLPARWEFIGGWADAQGRPFVLPHPLGDQARKYGCTGLWWSGLEVWCDPNIPLDGTAAYDQVVVCAADQVYVWRSPTPTIEVLPQPDAVNLEVLVRAYGYAACLTQYPTAVQTITGPALAPVSF